ncbi:TetR/AcrR family transcriptional regulator [Thalassobacillus sp. CUG 92003]|uniref:TetR/AcrR family transcriptional regulator n=1 Tax=Thalassobacillus sp. CUG 92003 TaxID=2736641 RepID=UPI0015E6AD1A|nr:TetR/AcrR family transcriptional regulator [Thalassobacillus sp. CUG 92003]
MPRGFSADESDKIMATLKVKGRSLFAQYGIRKTSVAQLTKAAGISQGSFYRFVESKEHLFYQLLGEEEERIKQTLAPFLKLEQPTVDSFKQMLLTAVYEVENSALLSLLFIPEEYEALKRKVDQLHLDAHTLDDLEELQPIIKRWQANGCMKHIEPEIITSTVRAFMLQSLHKHEIGAAWYDKTIEVMAESLAAYLIKRG